MSESVFVMMVMAVMMAMIDRPLVTVAPWFCWLSAASEAGDVVAGVVLGSWVPAAVTHAVLLKRH